jgi:5-formyltetrahydrofolate cyclo-ligase
MQQLSPAASIDANRRLRQRLRQKRSDIPDDVRHGYDLAIMRRLERLAADIGANKIAAYWPFNGEPDLVPLCKKFLNGGIAVLLPVIAVEIPGEMTFHAWHKDMPLQTNRFGIPEPPPNHPVDLALVDLLIMPLVGYDHAGNRLGMGAGYYDRRLEPLRQHETPLRIGVAYSFQETDPIDRNDWDVPLHGLVNEREFLSFVDWINPGHNDLT